jgi:hypothetical protein
MLLDIVGVFTGAGTGAVAVAVAFEAAVQLPVDRAVTAMPEADKVRRLFEPSAAQRV